MAKANFQYVINRNWRTAFKFGYGWFGWSDEFNAPFVLQAAEVNGDTTKGDQNLVLNPFTATIEYTHEINKNWMWFLGGGTRRLPGEHPERSPDDLRSRDPRALQIRLVRPLRHRRHGVLPGVEPEREPDRVRNLRAALGIQ